MKNRFDKSYTALPVSRTKKNTLLVDTSNGRPVWPIQSDQDYELLLKLTSLFGAQIEFVQSDSSLTEYSKNGSLAEIVVGIGEIAFDAARLYAHLTMRKVRFVENSVELFQGKKPDVIITGIKNINVKLLDFLYPPTEQISSPGLLFAENKKDIHRQVLIRSAAAFLCCPIASRRIDIFPLRPIGHIKMPGREMMGSKTSTKSIRKAIKNGSGILTIFSHSDGIHVLMDRKTTICPMPDASSTALGSFSPRCLSTNFCHWHKLPIDRAIRENLLITPDIINCRILLLKVCSGLLLSKVLNPVWGIAHKIASNSSVGAIITSWGMSITNEDQVINLADNIASGFPLGFAVARFNYAARQTGDRVCVLGDPRVRLPIETLNQLDSNRQDQSIHKKTFRKIPFKLNGNTAFLKVYLLSIIQNLSGVKKKLAQQALQKVDIFEEQYSKKMPLEGNQESPGTLLRQAFLTLLANTDTNITKVWTTFHEKMNLLEVSSCPSCGERLEIRSVKIYIPGVPHRRVAICSICGIIEDAPIDLPLRLLVRKEIKKLPSASLFSASFKPNLKSRSSVLGVQQTDSKKKSFKSSVFVNKDSENKHIGVTITSRLPETNWLGIAHMHSNLYSENTAWIWPNTKRGTPMREFLLPPPWPTGPIRSSVVFMCGTRIAVASMFIRAGKNT